MWAERGMLDDDPGSMAPDAYGTVGHHDRSPASYAAHGRGRDSWVSHDNLANNQRDRLRGSLNEAEESPSFRNNPQMAPSVKRQYKNGQRATRADFLDEAPNEGSLWASNGQTNYFFTKNRVRSVGDIVAVTIEESLLKDIGLDITRTLSPPEREVEVAAAQIRTMQKAAVTGTDRAGAAQAAPGRQDPAEGAPPPAAKGADEKTGTAASMAEIDVGPSLGVKAGETFMTEIVQRYPNGNYKVRGTKRIPYRGGSKLVSLLGILKGSDIGDEDTVTSGKLYEYRVEVVQ